jgi:hypothetical protein
LWEDRGFDPWIVREANSIKKSLEAEESGVAEESGGLELKSLTEVILGCAIRVQRGLGPGLLENAYEACLVYELEEAGLRVQRQLTLDITV